MEPAATNIYPALGFWFSVAQTVGYVILGIYVWISNSNKATAAEIKEVRDKMQTIQDMQVNKCGKHLVRTTTLEEKIKSTLTSKDLGAVYERVNQVGNTVESLKGTMSGINNNVNLLVEHHLKGGKS